MVGIPNRTTIARTEHPGLQRRPRVDPPQRVERHRKLDSFVVIGPFVTQMIDRMPRAQQVQMHTALNKVSRVTNFMRRQTEGRGMGGQIENVAETLRSLGRLVASLPAVDSEIDVLELGPGQTPHVAAAFSLCGARSVVGLDVVANLDSETSGVTSRFAELANALDGGSCDSFRAAMRASAASVRALSREAHHLPIVFGEFDGERLPLTSESVDLLVSHSVLEHVREDHVAGLLDEAFRVLRPGGAMLHWIDLRDHFRITGLGLGVNGDWLEALQFTTPEYEAMFCNRPVYINRLRSTQWRSLMERAGFEVAVWQETRIDLPVGFDARVLQPPWRTLSDEELGVALVECAVVKNQRP